MKITIVERKIKISEELRKNQLYQTMLARQEE